MSTPSINQGQIAIDPVSGILYYKTRSDEIVSTSLNLLQKSVNSIATEDSLEVGGNFLVSGDFTVSGNTVVLNTETLLIEDNIIVLNSNATGTPTINAGVEINRGNFASVQILWNESTDKWQFTNDGVNYYDIQSIENASINDLADVILSNTADGDFLRYNGSVWINDPVNLSTDTVGNYVQSLVSGTGVFISNNSGEGSTPTIAIGQDISASANVSFDTVTANFVGNVTGNVSSISTHNIDELADVVVTSVQNGQLLLYNGSAWINDVMPSSDHGSSTGLSDNDHPQYLLVEDHDTRDHSNALATASINDLSDVTLSNSSNGDFLRYNGSVWINNPVNLNTDTIGDYVASIVAGDGIELSNTGGANASPTISIAPNVINESHISLEFKYVNDVTAGNNIVIENNYFGIGTVGDYAIGTSATPNFDSVTTTSLFVDAIEIDPTGANSTDQVLRFDGTKFIPGVASTVASLSDLTDVSSDTPSSGDFLYWSGTEWMPAVPATGVPVVSATTPSTPVLGQLWFDSSSARTFIYYDSHWIEIGTAAPPVTTVTKYTEVIGNGSSSYSVVHNLNTRDLIIEIYDNSTYETLLASVTRTTLDTIAVSFSAPVTTNAYTVVVMG